MATRTKTDGAASNSSTDTDNNVTTEESTVVAEESTTESVANTPADPKEALAAKLQKKQAERTARRSSANAQPAREVAGEIPKVRIKIADAGGGSYWEIVRNADGTPKKHKRVLARGPKGQLQERLVPDIGGNLHMKRREIKLHEGSEYTMYADEAAGYIWKGYAALLEDHAHTQISLEELMANWVPTKLREHSEQFAAYSA